jgi:PBS lyase HEAT-like repeat-containing protein
VGLFDFLKRGRGEGETKPREGKSAERKPGDRKLESLSKKAADKRAQALDRDEAIRGLIQLGTPEAADALFKRFPFQVDPSITDQDEKQLAFDGIVSIGRGEKLFRKAQAAKTNDPKPEEIAAVKDRVVEAARAACRGAENLTWQLKVLRALLDDEPFEREVLEQLGKFDTEYTRNIEPKINLLAAMEELKSETVRQAAESWLDDVNETVRFHAVQTLFRHSDPSSLEPLLRMLEKEESMRVKNKVADGIVGSGSTIPEPLRARYQAALRDAYEYSVTSDGKVKRVR